MRIHPLCPPELVEGGHLPLEGEIAGGRLWRVSDRESATLFHMVGVIMVILTGPGEPRTCPPLVAIWVMEAVGVSR